VAHARAIERLRLQNETGSSAVLHEGRKLKMIISLRIDVTKIVKERLYKGEKGTYLDAILVLKDAKDKYGNDGSIKHSLSKEERESKRPDIYIGSAKVIYDSNRENAPRNKPNPKPEPDDPNQKTLPLPQHPAQVPGQVVDDDVPF